VGLKLCRNTVLQCDISAKRSVSAALYRTSMSSVLYCCVACFLDDMTLYFERCYKLHRRTMQMMI